MAIRARSNHSSFDWITFSIYCALMVIGSLMLYATEHVLGTDALAFTVGFKRQLVWVGISLFLFLLCLLIDWKVWYTFAYPLYGIGVVLLILVLFIGTEIKGAKSWIYLGPLSFQPSEFAKLSTSLAVSALLATQRFTFSNLRNVLSAFGLLALPIALILLQPDAGSALVFFSFFIVFYRNGLSTTLYLFGFAFVLVFVLALLFSSQIVLLILSLGLLLFYFLQFDQKLYWLFAFVLIMASVILLFREGFGWPVLAFLGVLNIIMAFLSSREKRSNVSFVAIFPFVILSLFAFGSEYAFGKLKPHQQDRINVWLQPDKTDPQGSRYNVLQSQMAIGSGGFQGKGFLNGTMTKLNYVPEQSTDFIFSTVGEEQGFIGCLGIIALYLMLLYRIINIGERSRHKFITNYAYCLAGIIFVHFFVNIGMTLGIMPVVGIPLILISKGGTSTAIFSIMIGILLKMDLEQSKR